jgi:hypothetical protein
VGDQIDWPDWLRRWDAQQEGYVPEREARFTAMFDALAATLLPASLRPSGRSALLLRLPGTGYGRGTGVAG